MFYDDNFRALIDFLPFDSIFTCRIVCKKWNEIVQYRKNKGLMTQRLLVFLEKYKVPKKILDKLEYGKFVLTGGFLLSVFLPEVWFDDIDIFMSENYDVKFLEEYQGEMDRIYEHTNPINVVWSKNIKSLCEKNIQITKSRLKNVINNIMNFDLDIVVNYYDGKTLCIAYPQSISNKTANMINSTNHTKEAFDYRKKKYEMKGFEINGNFRDIHDGCLTCHGKDPSIFENERKIYRKKMKALLDRK